MKTEKGPSMTDRTVDPAAIDLPPTQEIDLTEILAGTAAARGARPART